VESNPFESPEEQEKQKDDANQVSPRFRETLLDRIIGKILLIGLVPILVSLFLFSPVNGHRNSLYRYFDVFGEIYGILFGLFAIAYCFRRIFFCVRKYSNKNTH